MTNHLEEKPPGAGKSSFELIDSDILFRELPITKVTAFLDLGCGKGAYSIEALKRIGKNGQVYAVDLWAEGVAMLRARAEEEGFTNLTASVADLRGEIPIETDSVDVCLMSTVLHDLVEGDVYKGALNEAARALKPGAALAVVEYKKMDGPPGPPQAIRLAPEEVRDLTVPFGFGAGSVTDLGPYHYLSLFHKA